MSLEISPPKQTLRRNNLPTDPLKLFSAWFDEAWAAKIPIAHAMALATATKDGLPSARMVLLQSFNEQGFAFFTNYESPTARDLAENPQAALLFHWQSLGRQVRINGRVSKVSRAESEAYFRSRPFGSQLNASIPNQSQPTPNRQVLESFAEELKAKHPDGHLPLPPFWGGYRVAPVAIEFWQECKDRLHDRFRYMRSVDETWLIERLTP